MKARVPLSRICLAGVATWFLLSATLASAQFVDVSSEAGLSAARKKTWGNPVWGDFNHDGFLDLIVPDHGLAASQGPFVYLNSGGTSFVDIRPTCGITKAPAFDSTDWHGYAMGDFDGDGNVDLYIAEGAKGNVGGADKRDLLFHSNGDGTFTNVSVAAGILVTRHRGRGALWFDFDNDGQLDLLVKNFSDVNDLYKNNGNGTFSLVPNAAGLAYATSGVDAGSIMAMADYDNDGYMDIAFTGDNDALALYRHMNDGTYADVTSAAGITFAPNSKGMAWGDYDNDGLIDLYIARGQLSKTSSAGTLYRNNGNGTF
ncbi:MAG: VCBS repeat-containing protein, partial [Chthoniobacterales bacterium]